MPHWLRRYLTSTDLRAHFLRALMIGAILRLLSSWFVYGPQALDDYKHGVYPAYQFFAGLPLDLPEYRSHLLVWFLGGFLWIAAKVGAMSALAQVRAMYMGLGLTSLLGIVGTYLYVRNFRSRLFAPLALYFVAMFPLMPFVGTRAFGESVAMSFVLLGFGLLESSRRQPEGGHFWMWALGFLSVGVATLFRFHVGIIYLMIMVIAIFDRKWRGFFAGAFSGLLTLGAQIGIDYLSGKGFLGTLFNYLGENEGGGAKYGVSPWYNPWLFVLAVSLAPFSFVLFKSVRGLWRKHWRVILPALLFVGVHSLVPHKEERFLYPIMGIELWAMAYLWASNSFNRWARKIYSPALLIIGCLGLIVVCFLNTQEGEIEPPAYAEKNYGQVIYLDNKSLFGQSRFQFYFLRPPSELKEVEPADLNAHSVDEALAANSQFKAAVLLTSEEDSREQLRALEGISTLEAKCGKIREAGSAIDLLLYKMNPKHNQRRRPTWYLICERLNHAI